MHCRSKSRQVVLSLAALCLPALLARAQSSAESQYTSFLNMGARLIEIHEPGKAVGFYAKCANILPERPESYREMSRTLLGMGEKDEAAFWWREAKRRAPNDAALEEIRAQFPAGVLDDATSGKVAKIELRYLGRAATDARGGEGGSIDAGQAINPALLFAQGFDSTGRAVPMFKPEWTGVSGAKSTPSTGEKVVARDAASGATAEIAVRVVGKAQSIRLYDVATRKELKEALYVPPGEKRSIRVNAQDAAGNALALKEYRWAAEKDQQPTPDVLQTEQTYASPEFPFEPVANVFRAPVVTEPTPFGIIVTDPATGVKGRAEVVVAPNAEKLASGRPGWLDRFEDTLQAAESQGKLAMVEFQAPW
ncbi:MAG: hypothetical protein HY292_15060 [Planctomycetes bacterium]|nr:hypothetical protein [Planctomycetota bacterium]